MAYDSWASQINGLPLNVHFYIMDLAHAGSGGANLIPFNMSGQVINLLYMPFLEWNDFNHGTIYTYDFDQKYFGTAKPDASGPEDFMSPAPQVYKIYGNVNIQTKLLGEFDRYPTDIGRTSGRSWKNESKIYQFPYHFNTVNDYLNSPLMVKNNLLPTTGTNKVYVRVYQPLTITGGYTIYIPEYKGDKSSVGANEGMIANAGLDLPTSSSEYAQYMATSKSQLIASHDATTRNAWANIARGAISFATGAFQAGLGAVAMGASGGTATMMGAGTMVGAGVLTAGQGIMDMAQAGLTLQNRVENSQAQLSDMLSAPRNVSLSSADVLTTINRNNKKITVNRYMPSPYYRQKLANYWHLYGYRQAKVMTPNTKNRRYWNYIQTLNAKVKSNAMDKTEIEIMQTIFNKGIRFWHQQNGPMHDYEKDNVEV